MTRKEALEYINNMWMSGETHDALEVLIPEFGESEDEWIRKELKEAFEAYDIESKWNGIPIRSIFAWLEKQKEKSEIPIMDGDTDTYFDDLRMTTKPLTSREWFDEGIKYAQRLQKERGPLTKEEEYILHRIIEYLEDETCPSEWISLLHDIYCLPYEKQKEQKPDTRDADDLQLLGFIYDLLNEIEWKDSWAMSKDECLRRLNNYRPQKPAEWSEDYREEDIQTRFAFYTYKDEDGVLYLSNVFVEETSRNHGFGTKILIAAEKVAETIGATTISLKVKQDSPANAWYRKNGYGYVAFEDGYDWLEKNLEYMKPNKQEWSEEDKEKIVTISEIIEHCTTIPYSGGTLTLNKEYKKELLCFIRTLRPSWKPSEEQMKALNALNCHGDLSYIGQQNQLISLYNDLKKLI